MTIQGHQSFFMNRFDSVLDLNSAYHCPVCRHGEISSLALMDAFACNFCRHIFAANLDDKSIEMVDSHLPLSWRWNGNNWQGIHRPGVELGFGYWVIAILFILLPTAIVGLGAYFFPPLPGAVLGNFSIIWTCLTFFAHLTCVLWLIVEYYQFPILLYVRSLGARLFQRTS